jgi:hypothetical protein
VQSQRLYRIDFLQFSPFQPLVFPRTPQGLHRADLEPDRLRACHIARAAIKGVSEHDILL